MGMHLYEVVGRAKPTDKHPVPQVYRMKLFAANAVVARSRFWYFIRQLVKMKKTTGEIIETHELFEKNPNVVDNYGFWIRYDSRSGTHNMYKEYRDTTLTGAAEQMYKEMASRHRARKANIQVIRTAVVPASKCRRDNTVQFHNSNIEFRQLHRIPRPSSRQFAKQFKASKPSTFF
jgi:large subunit ribosomal protein L18Ae